MRRPLLGLPIFEAIFAVVVLTAIFVVLILPIIGWIRSPFKWQNLQARQCALQFGDACVGHLRAAQILPLQACQSSKRGRVWISECDFGQVNRHYFVKTKHSALANQSPNPFRPSVSFVDFRPEAFNFRNCDLLLIDRHADPKGISHTEQEPGMSLRSIPG